jgi:hypothetical protein
MSSSEAYILNTLQTPDGLRTVYDSIADGNETEEEIVRDTGIREEAMDWLVDGLVLLGMIRRSEHAYQVVEPEWETGDPERDFRLSALHRLATEAQGDGWGKQSVVLLNYQYLIEENIQRFENNQRPLYEDIDSWIRRETSYRPKGEGELYEHNDPKFGNWTRLVHYLGLTYKMSGREHTVYPDPEVILASIELAADESEYVSGGAADLSLREYLEWLDENLIRIGYTGGDPVPPVLARVLFGLVREFEIEVIESGDGGAVDLSRTPRTNGIEKEANAIKLL